MRQLRDPQSGCPWDLAQDARSLTRYALEEAYELVAAIESGKSGAVRDELGDLLFQVVFHAQLASERGEYDFDAVAGAIADKLLRRHPHVFGDGVPATPWEQIKAQERACRGEGSSSVEDEIGDLLLAVTSLARQLGVDPETALRRANGRFESRFRHMEQQAAARGESLRGLDAGTLDLLWRQAKQDVQS
jgi:uncharacterized protein YabN with tetrapyrrole methylase and pyrophosphatase domain